MCNLRFMIKWPSQHCFIINRTTFISPYFTYPNLTLQVILHSLLLYAKFNHEALKMNQIYIHSCVQLKIIYFETNIEISRKLATMKLEEVDDPGFKS